MKKLIAILTVILCLGFTSAFAQEFKYSGFVKTVIDMEGFAVINEDVYQPGEVIKGSTYKLIRIEYDYVLLEDINDHKQIKIGFYLGNRPSNS